MPFAAAAQEVELSNGAPNPTCYPVQLPSCMLPALWGTRSSPTALPLPSHLTGSKTQQAPGQCERERKHETEPVGKGTQWGIACPQAVPRKQAGPCPSPQACGLAGAPQQPWRLAGNAKRSAATRPFLDQGRSILQQTTQHGRPFSYLKATIHSCEYIQQEPCFPPSQMLHSVAVSWTMVAGIVQPPPYPTRMPGQHRLGLAVSFAIFSA